MLFPKSVALIAFVAPILAVADPRHQPKHKSLSEVEYETVTVTDYPTVHGTWSAWPTKTYKWMPTSYRSGDIYGTPKPKKHHKTTQKIDHGGPNPGYWTVSCHHEYGCNRKPAHSHHSATTPAAYTTVYVTQTDAPSTLSKYTKPSSSHTVPVVHSTVITKTSCKSSSTPSAKTTTVLVTKPCHKCTDGTTTQVKTIIATSFVTYPPQYITTTVKDTVTVSPTHPTMTPIVKTLSSCKTFTVPPSKSWVWPHQSHTPKVYRRSMTSTVYATSVATITQCSNPGKHCSKHTTEQTSTIPVSTTICPVTTTSSSSSSESISTYHSTTTQHVTSTKSVVVPYPSSTRSAITTITSTSCKATTTYSSGSSTWTSQYTTTSMVTAVVPTSSPVAPGTASPPAYTPAPSSNGTVISTPTPVMPISNGAEIMKPSSFIAVVAVVAGCLML